MVSKISKKSTCWGRREATETNREIRILVEADPQFGIHKLIKRIKGSSVFILRSEFPFLKSSMPNMWTNSYFFSTVGGAPLSIVKQYIESQKMRGNRFDTKIIQIQIFL